MLKIIKYYGSLKIVHLKLFKLVMCVHHLNTWNRFSMYMMWNTSPVWNPLYDGFCNSVPIRVVFLLLPSRAVYITLDLDVHHNRPHVDIFINHQKLKHVTPLPATSSLKSNLSWMCLLIYSTFNYQCAHSTNSTYKLHHIVDFFLVMYSTS
jgi:hypothetical protein